MVIGIVCEFDPLHRGHARLLSHARALARTRWSAP